MERVLDQLKLCVEAAGASMSDVLAFNVSVTSADMFPAENAAHRRCVRDNWPARIFIDVPARAGRFDIAVDRIAAA